MNQQPGARAQERILHRSPCAPEPRTLLEIFAATTSRHPDAFALDDGRERLTYTVVLDDMFTLAAKLRAVGIGRGDRVGVRIPSGTNDLYLAILGVLAAGACYVPVDADDPDPRAEVVFREAGVTAVLGSGGAIVHPPWAVDAIGGAGPPPPGPDDDAWIIFTSGSTGTPKGVAVTHRSAAAFVDAEARLFLRDAPMGPKDRVLAGLSVGFDASCEEMWLAWRHGACLVPAPRSLVRTGMDLGPWLIAQDITVVSTVPTLASLWPPEALDAVRLLIFGGEACPPELGSRLAVDSREVWNTYGPTEATVVACAALLGREGPVRIGLPLDGWDLAVVDADGHPVPDGGEGELVIGGVGLARYLDGDKDAEKYAPLPTLGWERAYRSGDNVRFEPEGLVFLGRIDDQVKVGGRRIELGEVDAALLALEGVAGAAAAVKTAGSGNQLLVGYLVAEGDRVLDTGELVAELRQLLPAPLIPLLAIVDEIPTKTSGKVDRDALPWPPPRSEPSSAEVLSETAAWVAEHWTEILGMPATSPADDFFAHGGGSLSAARLVSLLRERFPEVTVADIYASPRIGALADALDQFERDDTPTATRAVTPLPRRAQALQTLLSVPLQTIVAMRWFTLVAVINQLLASVAGASWARPMPPAGLAALCVVFFTAPGRMLVTAACARLLLRSVTSGVHPRGGSAHLRIWFAERLGEAMGADQLSGAAWVPYFARALGARVEKGVVLHSLPPVTGKLRLDEGCSIEPEVDLSGYWIDGDELHVGATRVGAGARVGSRSTLLPGATIGAGAHVEAGSAVQGKVPAGQSWAGSPAVRVTLPSRDWPEDAPPRGRAWIPPFVAASIVIGGLPLAAAAVGLAMLGPTVASAASVGDAARAAAPLLPIATFVSFSFLALVTIAFVRLLSIGLRPGHHPVRSRIGWQAWATMRLMDDARTWLFPLYSSLVTPVWLRLLGAKIGRGVEASTVVMIPCMTTVGDESFLADDTLVGGYELAGGWLRIEPVKIGRRAFLGNSGMTAPGRRVRRNSLVAVLSAAPERAKPGSSWLGSPPVRLRRAADDTDESLTFTPPRRVVAARLAVELLRFVPVAVSAGIGLVVITAMATLVDSFGWLGAFGLGGVVLLIAGAAAAVITTVSKWVIVGRIPAGDHPLWESFVWRTEVVDTFVEIVAAPWFARAATGTPALTMWLRSLGTRIGRGTWCETYWLPEADLVTLGKGASVNRGCVLQTHLFHDRVMSLDTVSLGDGATLGPHGVILPAAEIGAGTTVGPASLVMRGDVLPAGTRWTGNPIAVWRPEVKASS